MLSVQSQSQETPCLTMMIAKEETCNRQKLRLLHLNSPVTLIGYWAGSLCHQKPISSFQHRLDNILEALLEFRSMLLSQNTVTFLDWLAEYPGLKSPFPWHPKGSHWIPKNPTGIWNWNSGTEQATSTLKIHCCDQ